MAVELTTVYRLNRDKLKPGDRFDLICQYEGTEFSITVEARLFTWPKNLWERQGKEELILVITDPVWLATLKRDRPAYASGHFTVFGKLEIEAKILIGTTEQRGLRFGFNSDPIFKGINRLRSTTEPVLPPAHVQPPPIGVAF